ncbi:response regulator [Cohnella rhizosphaerae]|uniref:Response regulator n=1 Tax=Cohnella rhizosphaerae TaxID=1457232 RepID=A0A9X4KTD8_9BACL|nr:response regulator [Cohnella rhizosphaerae]MDG0810645.1 response regulator [Cohnella rhizosphaerae]
MFQVLLVDDHAHLVDSLVKSIPWESLGISQVHTAYSGPAALEVLDTYPVDILVTDIRMPGLSGLELIRRVMQARKRIKCIVMSGYADFEYARQALQFDTVDYILKPAEDEEIVASLRKATELIHGGMGGDQLPTAGVDRAKRELPQAEGRTAGRAADRRRHVSVCAGAAARIAGACVCGRRRGAARAAASGRGVFCL